MATVTGKSISNQLEQAGTAVGDQAAMPSVPKGISTYLMVVSVVLHLAGAVAALVVSLQATSGQTADVTISAVLAGLAGIQTSVLSIVRSSQAKHLTTEQRLSAALPGLQGVDAAVTSTADALAGHGTTGPDAAPWPTPVFTDLLPTVSAETVPAETVPAEPVLTGGTATEPVLTEPLPTV